MDMKSISQKLQDDIRAIMEANIKHQNQQAIDVHEPEKDEITAHDFKKLRAMKKDPHGKVTKEDTDDQIQELAGKAAQQAAIAISLIKAGKKDGKMPKPMKETAELEETKGAPKGHHFTKGGQLKRGDANQDGHGGPMLRTDPKDKMRNKIPPVTEEDKKVVSPFDYKNYQSQIPKKPGETAGFDSKKISTGTVYSRKPVKEESHQSKTTMKHIPNPSPALKDAAKRIKPGIAGIRDRFDMLRAGGVKGGPGGVKEEMEQIDEITKSEVEHHHDEWMNSDHAPFNSDAGNDNKVHKKALSYLSSTNVPKEKHEKLAMHIADKFHGSGIDEEAQIDELSKSTLGSYLTKKTSEYMKGKTQPGTKEHAKDVQNMGKAYDKLKKEEAELDEAYQTAKSEFVARQGRLTDAGAKTEKDPVRLKRMSSIPGYSAAMDLAKKTTQGAKHTKEEVEQMDELSTSTLKSYISGAQKDRASQSDSKNSGDRKEANYAKKQIVKRTLGIVDAKSRLNKEDVEQMDELSVNTLNRVHRAAVKSANDASRDGDEARADKRYNLAGKASNKAELKNRAAGLKPSGQHALESVEQEEYTFADYLEAARAQYVDEDAVFVANEAFKNQDITLFNYQSQSPEA